MSNRNKRKSEDNEPQTSNIEKLPEIKRISKGKNN